MKHIVCYSGGHSSALVALEVFRKYGKDDLILLNHDIHASVEDADIKRFKTDVSNHIGIEITYANMKGFDTKDQFDVVVEAQAFKVGNGTALCTNRMKTGPFEKYLEEKFPEKDCVIYYGFDANEKQRIQRRSQILGAKGYKTEYPLAFWERTIQSTQEIGIAPPLSYSLFKHANCTGCLKAGRQHWYVVFCTRPDIWNKGKWSEEEIGYTIIKDISLLELEPLFEKMRCAGIEATEKTPPGQFWKQVREKLSTDISDDSTKPCECVI